MKLMDTILPEVINERAPAFLKKLEEKSLNNSLYEFIKTGKKILDDYEFPVEVDFDEEKLEAKISIITGRKSWISTIKRMLTINVDVLLQHNWSIVNIDPNVELVTTDDPVVCLNLYKDRSYDYQGGWKRKGANIIFPLSPNCLLFTEIGKRIKSRLEFDNKTSVMIRDIVAKHSLRFIYSKNKINEISFVCPREVNSEKYKSEEAFWSSWHKIQN